MSLESIIIENLDIWTSAIKTKSASGRGSSNKLELYGIKKLRELILELAIRGKLIAQNPNDEPAKELLKRTEAQKEVLLIKGKIKKSRKLEGIDKGEVPFELPNGWEWVLMDQLGHGLGQEKPSSTFSYIDVGCIDKANGVIKEPDVVNAEDAPSRARKLVKQGSILYSTVRPYLLNIAVVEKDILPKPIASTAFAVIQPFDGINSSYIYRYLRSPTFVSYVESVQTGVAYPAINDKQFYSGLFPLPPSEEQERIVAKVDELMALCDQLESQTEASVEAHQTLVKSLLEALTNAKDADELNESWQRISAHFDVLFTTEDSIDQLKQTILQLAVMGKLVKQDPNDEPASKLLERIAVEKQQLIKDGKIKKQKALPPITDEEKPFELPNCWTWAQCTDTCNPESIITYGILKPVWKEQGVATARIKDMIDGKIILDDIVKCCKERAAKFEKTKLLAGDLLIAKDGGTLGKTAFVPIQLEGGNITQHVLRYSISSKLNKFFMRMIIDSPIGQKFMKGETKGVALPGVNVGDFRRMAMAIPPLAEQRRIVTKVEELMTLCNSLKANLKDAQTTQLHLPDTIVESTPY